MQSIHHAWRLCTGHGMRFAKQNPDLMHGIVTDEPPRADLVSKSRHKRLRTLLALKSESWPDIPQKTWLL